MKGLFNVLFCIVFLMPAKAQDTAPGYIFFSKKADSCFEKKSYNLAAKYYALAIQSNGDQGLVSHRYNYACCLVKISKNNGAFYQLDRIATRGKFYNYLQLSSDECFKHLQGDVRWNALIQRVKRNSEEVQQKLNEGIH